VIADFKENPYLFREKITRTPLGGTRNNRCPKLSERQSAKNPVLNTLWEGIVKKVAPVFWGPKKFRGRYQASFHPNSGGALVRSFKVTWLI